MRFLKCPEHGNACVDLVNNFCDAPLLWYILLFTLYTLVLKFSYNSAICIFFCISQEVLVWLTALQKELGGEVSDEKMRDYIWNTLKSGRVKTHHTNILVIII